jgi:hypothetical protein
MSDDKRAPAPQAPVDSGTSAPAAPRPSAEPRASTVGAPDTTDVDPYKVRRVTIPPDMRVKMLDWWKNRRHEDLPKDTLPPQPSAPDEPTPKRTLEPDTIRNFPPPGKTPDSVTPVGVSTVPMKSLRGIAVAVALVAAALLLLVVIFRRGERPRVTEPASAVSGLRTAFTSEPPRASVEPAPPPKSASALPPVFTNAPQNSASSSQTAASAPPARPTAETTSYVPSKVSPRSLAKPKPRPLAASPQKRPAQPAPEPEDVPFGPKPK